MQTRFRLPLLILAAALVVFSSCSKKTNKEGRYVPKNASFVFLINGESVSSKLPWEEIRKNEMFKDIYEEYGLDNKIKAVLDNPENAGIDIKKNMLFFVQKDSIGGYVAVEGTIKDAAKFKDYNSAINKGAAETEKDGIHFLSSDKITTSWDKDKFVIVIDVPGMGETNGWRKRYNSTDSTSSSTGTKRDAIATAKNIYSLTEENSLAKDEKFSDLVNTKGDIHLWVSVGSLMSNNPGMAALSMMNMSKFYESTFYTAAIDFDNGKIVIDIKSYVGKELADIYKKYGGSKLNTDMLKRIPSKDVAALFALSFKPEGLKELVKLMGVEGFINLATSEFGFTFDDFIKANKGDILFSVSDIKKDSNVFIPRFNALFSASIGDKNSFGKLIEAGKKLGKEKMSSNESQRIAYNSTDNYFVIGNDKLTNDKFLSTANNNNFDFVDKASGATSLLYLNIPALMTGFNDKNSMDSLENLSMEATLKMFETIIATGEGFKNDASNQHVEINLVDKNTNSLKQLNTYIGTMGSIQKQKKSQRDKWMNQHLDSDTTKVMEAPLQQ